ncbi:MAG: hypothetical protein HY720_27920 [Planctomycetes bacterium]|nr:hypothetical protein [Planctomycetota bacterium]
MDGTELPLAAEGLARRLEELARGLDPREEALLRTILCRAMDPIARAGERPSSEILDPAEERFLRELERQAGA